MISSKIEIIKYFDELINQVDIDIEECLEKYNEQQILGDLSFFQVEKRKFEIENYSSNIIKLFESQQTNRFQKVDEWSESIKVVDYLKQIRIKTIEELKKAQEESLEYYKLNSSQLKTTTVEKFYFQVNLNIAESNPWIFNLFTFVTDFYMSPCDINILEMLVNNYYGSDFTSFSYIYRRSFDEKMLLICLLAVYFRLNLATEKFPNHVISVSKRDTLNIQEIYLPSSVRVIKLNSSIELSKLELLKLENNYFQKEIELDGLFSLESVHLSLHSLERFSARNLTSLKCLRLDIKEPIDERMSVIFENLTSLKELVINGFFSDLNLDSLVNLDKLELYGSISEDFNYGLLKNLCDHVQKLSICFSNIDDNQISQLFYGHKFRCLLKLKIESNKITKLEKKLFEGFPKLQSLNISYNEELRIIDYDAFSSLTNLVNLYLHDNCIERLDYRTFSQLVNLVTLNLSNNFIRFVEEHTFSNLKSLIKLDLTRNQLILSYSRPFYGKDILKKCNLLYKEADKNLEIFYLEDDTNICRKLF